MFLVFGSETYVWSKYLCFLYGHIIYSDFRSEYLRQSIFCFFSFVLRSVVGIFCASGRIVIRSDYYLLLEFLQTTKRKLDKIRSDADKITVKDSCWVSAGLF